MKLKSILKYRSHIFVVLKIVIKTVTSIMLAKVDQDKKIIEVTLTQGMSFLHHCGIIERI